MTMPDRVKLWPEGSIGWYRATTVPGMSAYKDTEYVRADIADKPARQRDALLEAANRASMLTGAMVASQFWDPPARELARPVDEALRAAIAACEDES